MAGGSIGRHSAARIQAVHTAVNYTPVAVGSESTNKVSAHIKGIDNALAALASDGATGRIQISDGAGGFTSSANLTYSSNIFKVGTTQNVSIGNTYDGAGGWASNRSAVVLDNGTIRGSFQLNPSGGMILCSETNHRLAIGINNAEYLTFETAGYIATLSGIEVCALQSGDRNSLIDFHSDDTYTDYSLRIIRSPGANGGASITHRGTGIFEIRTVEAAPIDFVSSSSLQLRIGNITSAVNYAFINGSTSTNPVTLGAWGSDSNIDIALTPRGTGWVKSDRPIQAGGSGAADNFLNISLYQVGSGATGYIASDPSVTAAAIRNSSGQDVFSALQNRDVTITYGGLVFQGSTVTSTANGTMYWNGSDFLGRKGGAWVSFTSAGGDALVDDQIY